MEENILIPEGLEYDENLPVITDRKIIKRLVYPPKIFLIPTDTCYWIACHVFDIKSYNKIYEIKGRTFKKPLAVIVPDFEWLREHTILNDEQIEFLKNYERPFTILTNIKSRKKLIPKNYKMLKKIALRVANNDTQKEAIQEHWLLFLTSANRSWEADIFKEEELEKVFDKEIDEWVVDILKPKTWEKKSSNEKSSSDIFAFIKESTDRFYLRKA